MTKDELVRTELAKLQEAQIEDDDFIILCPFHDDHNPSLRVSLIERVRKKPTGEIKTVTPGNFYCFACRAGGGWNNLVEKIEETRGIKLVAWNRKEAENTPSDPIWSLSKQIQALSKPPWQYRKPATEGGWEDAWRGLSGKFLRSVGAETLWDEDDEDYRIYLPVHDISQKLIGHVGARPDNSTIPDKRKYINSYMFPKESNWYLLNLSVPTDKVVIVEGPFDTLRLRNEGLPAIGAYGVSDCYDQKVFQLLASGVKKAVLCLDGDRAGRESTPMFTAALQRNGIEVADMNLTQYGSDKVDPGNMPQEAIDDLKFFFERF